MEQRIAELEAKLALAEDLLEALNGTVYRQQERMDLLESQLRLLYQQVRSLGSGEEPGDPAVEVPPHY
ncbi:MAG: SlyX family protein [Pseudomonadota bacterium]